MASISISRPISLDVTESAGLQNLKNLFFGLVAGHDQDAGVAELLANLLDHLDPAFLRHAQVEQKHVWPQFAEKRDGLGAVGGFAHNLETRLGRNQAANADAVNQVVVGDQDADWF